MSAHDWHLLIAVFWLVDALWLRRRGSTPPFYSALIISSIWAATA